MNNYTILVIEDNEDINFLTKTTLLSKGYKVICCYNGKEGIETAFKENISLIILDVMMPDMDGYEVLEILKSNEKTTHIPIAFFSAKTQSDEIEKGISLGAVKYFKKPFDPMELLVEVEKLLIIHS